MIERYRKWRLKRLTLSYDQEKYLRKLPWRAFTPSFCSFVVEVYPRLLEAIPRDAINEQLVIHALKNSRFCVTATLNALRSVFPEMLCHDSLSPYYANKLLTRLEQSHDQISFIEILSICKWLPKQVVNELTNEDVLAKALRSICYISGSSMGGADFDATSRFMNTFFAVYPNAIEYPAVLSICERMLCYPRIEMPRHLESFLILPTKLKSDGLRKALVLADWDDRHTYSESKIGKLVNRVSNSDLDLGFKSLLLDHIHKLRIVSDAEKDEEIRAWDGTQGMMS